MTDPVREAALKLCEALALLKRLEFGIYCRQILEAERARLITQLEPSDEAVARELATFGLAVLDEMRVDGGGDIDGGWAQDTAEKLGVIVGVEVTEPCHPENCVCAEFGFPVTCYRDSAATKAFRAVTAAREDTTTTPRTQGGTATASGIAVSVPVYIIAP